MSKKNKIIAIIAILLAVFISFMGGQTFSKYVTEVKGVGNASIATWNFNVKDGEDKQIQTIDLVSTANNETLVDNKIAPGTSGSFVIKIDGAGSEVGIAYNIQIANETKKPENLIYTYEGKTYNSIAQLAQEASGEFKANASEEEKVKEIQIGWNWAYETGNDDTQKLANNKKDTQDGMTIRNYTFDIIVTGTQVMPNA